MRNTQVALIEDTIRDFERIGNDVATVVARLSCVSERSSSWLNTGSSDN